MFNDCKGLYIDTKIGSSRTCNPQHNSISTPSRLYKEIEIGPWRISNFPAYNKVQINSLGESQTSQRINGFRSIPFKYTIILIVQIHFNPRPIKHLNPMSIKHLMRSKQTQAQTSQYFKATGYDRSMLTFFFTLA